MAKNNLTPTQDLLVREFYVNIAQEFESIISSNPDNARRLRRTILDLLNYDVIGNGTYVTKGTIISVKYGTSDFSAYPDEWEADTRRAEEALENEADNDTNTSEASTSESTESPEVRETVLREDV